MVVPRDRFVAPPISYLTEQAVRMIDSVLYDLRSLRFSTIFLIALNSLTSIFYRRSCSTTAKYIIAAIFLTLSTFR